MFNLFNRVSGAPALVLILSVLGGLILMIMGMQGTIGFEWMGAVLGVGTAVSLTAAFAKSDDEDDDNWLIGLTAVGNFALVYAILTNLPDLYDSQFMWAVAIAVLAGVVILYRAYPNWWVWPIAFLMGGRVCSVGAGLLYWGLSVTRYLAVHGAGRPWEILCFIVTGVFTFAWVVGTMMYVDYKGQHGIGNLRATTMPGDGFGIHRKKALAYVVANVDNVPRTELSREQRRELRQLQRAKDYDGIVEWAVENDLELDPRWFLSLYLMELPNIWMLPIFAKIAPWNAKFDLAHSGDEDSEEHGGQETSPRWIHFTLRPIPDVDVVKSNVSTGQRSEPVSITTGVDEMRIVNPWHFMKFAIDWRHHLDTARDNLAAAIGALCGPATLMIAGHDVFELLEGFVVQVATAFGTGTAMFPGAPLLQRAIDAYGHIIAHLGLESTAVTIKRVTPSGAVDAARAAMTRAAGDAEVASLVLNARLQAIDAMLRGAEFSQTERAEIIRAVLPPMMLGDNGGIASALAQFGLASNVAQGVARAAAPGGGRGGGGTTT